ncbi:MAG: hypothetical protein FIA97_16360 [Methylococcaceae bacterium]|nr:hypothetical protein [Methylococcaceae bacterium]
MHRPQCTLCKTLLLSAALGYASLFLFAAEARAVSVSVNNFRGDWNAATYYRAGDVVGYLKQSYIAQTGNRGQTPAAGSTVWYLLAAQGPQGAAGTNGINGKDGINGTNGKDGINGTNGIDGKDGAQGPKGDTGPKPVYAYSLVVGQNPAAGDGTGRVLAAPDYTTITDALNAIPANLYDATAGTCSARYLVKVLPGVYPESVAMKACVDLEGSGEANTRITYTNGKAATLAGAPESEVRYLTVENITVSALAQVTVAVQYDDNTFKLSHVTVTGKNDYPNGTFNYGVRGAGGALSDVTVNLAGQSSCYGVTVLGAGELSLEGVTVNVTCQVDAVALRAIGSAQAKVTNSSLHGANESMGAHDNSYVRIAHSELDGPVFIDTANGASAVCAGSYDGNFQPLTLRGCLSPNALP